MADGWKLSVEPTTAYLDSLRPAGSKRSGKRDLIVNVFLRQEGHLTADDLYDLIRGKIRKSAAPPSTARCSGWKKRASRARSILARAGSASSTRTGIRATFI